MSKEEKATEDLDMRAFLIEQMTKVMTGKLTPMQAEAVASIAQQIYNFEKLEREEARDQYE